MNINGGNSVQKLVKNFEQGTVQKQPEATAKVETGMTGKTFAERKAIFERQTQQEPVEDLASSQNLASIEQSIEELVPETVQEQSQVMNGLYTVSEPGNQYASSYTMVSFDDSDDDSDDDFDYGEYREIELSEVSQEDPEVPQKYDVTAKNHHAVNSRQDSIAPGIKKGDEFALRGAGRYTAMFQGDAQQQNQLHIDNGSISRGESEAPLSTQTDKRGLWAGSKAARMIFVMNPQGEIHAINPGEKLKHNDVEIADVRIHHSSLLDGGKVAGAGEMQVSAGLTEEESQQLQSAILKQVQAEVGKENLGPEAAQEKIKAIAEQTLSRMMKDFQPGQLEVISDRSGHYRPSLDMTAQVVNEFEEQGVDLRRVNVELGDKTGRGDALEGELMVPASTVQASQGIDNAENELRNVQARKLNMQQELLAKTGGSSEKTTQQIEKLKNRLTHILNSRDTDKYQKAAVVYERLALMEGVDGVKTHKINDGQSLQKTEAKSVLNKIKGDFDLSYADRKGIKQAYKAYRSEALNREKSQEDPLDGTVEMEMNYVEVDSDFNIIGTL